MKNLEKNADRIRMFASVGLEEYKDRFLRDGIKAGEIDGTSGGKPAILVQHLPFPLGCDDYKCKVVEFVCPVDVIWFDEDDDVEMAHLLPDGAKNYAGLNPNLVAGECMYGSYVLEIKPEWIICVHEGEWRGDNWYMDGAKE